MSFFFLARGLRLGDLGGAKVTGVTFRRGDLGMEAGLVLLLGDFGRETAIGVAVRRGDFGGCSDDIEELFHSSFNDESSVGSAGKEL